jgi:hypothetical protein
MRKLRYILVLAIFASALTAITAESASAAHRGKRCAFHEKSGVNETICALVNQHDLLFELEGMGCFAQDCAGEGPTQITFDWVRLRRGSNDALLRECTSSACGAHTYYGTCNACSPWQLSTPWNAGCLNTYYAEIRYKLRWITLSGDPVTGWHYLKSAVVDPPCDQ